MPPRLTPLAPAPLQSLLLRLRHPSTPGRPSSTFTPRPAPPKLPADQQAEFERLQRTAAVSSAFAPGPSATASTATATAATSDAARPAEEKSGDDDNDNVNRGLFRGAPPEFRGQVNPKTGEVGGPKNEPLRWGGSGDWSYNGRVTDF